MTHVLETLTEVSNDLFCEEKKERNEIVLLRLVV